jgi:hypothetical protein
LASVVRAQVDERPEVIRDAILREIEAFTGELAPEDDRTLVVAAYLGNDSSRASSDAIEDRTKHLLVMS